MNSLKRKISLCISLTLVMLVNTTVVSFAQTNSKKVVFSSKEITDINEINNRLNNNITDDHHLNAASTLSKDTIQDEKGNIFKLIPGTVKVTSQKTEATLNEDGSTTSNYTAYAKANTEIVPFTSGQTTNTSSVTDNSSSSTVYLKVTYETDNFSQGGSDFDLCKFDAVSSEVKILDSTVSLTKLTIRNNLQGAYYTDSSATNYVTTAALSSGTTTLTYPNGGTYYNITPLSYYVNTASGVGSAFERADAVAYCTRGGSSWTNPIYFEYQN